MSSLRLLALALLALLVAAAPAAAQRALTPDYEAATFAKTQERFRFLVSTPAYQQQLREKGAEREADLAEIRAGDAERDPSGNLCEQRMDGCAGDVRFYDWAKEGGGVALPVLWTARNGSAISGHVWATNEGPAKRPGVVITTGSVQAPEELYWFIAQTLAKAGYVVLTWDVQGQGYSDTYGEGADRNDGVPSQQGVPFYDGTEDALDFFFSTPAERFVPRRSCTTGTDHDAKQLRRVKAGTASAYNPFHGLLDLSKVGVVGQSLGAGAVSYIGQIDPRVRAIVALDNLREPDTHPACASGSSPRPDKVVPTVPALGMAGDYGLVVTPNTSQPQADSKAAASKAISGRGVESGEIVIRGGTHYEFDFIPNPAFGATLRGMDMTAWYTRAWIDRHVAGRAGARADLLTTRWQADPKNGEVDQLGDPNLFSEYYRSRLGLSDATCEGLRTAMQCPSMKADARGTEPYDALIDAYRKDAPTGRASDAAKPWVVSTSPAGASGVPPAANKLPANATPGGGSGGGPAGGGGSTGSGSGPGATPRPGTTTTADGSCRDVAAPKTRLTRRGSRIGRRGLALRGTAFDRGCVRGGRTIRVQVAVGRIAPGGRCRWMRPDGRLATTAASCSRPVYADARGTRRWTLRTTRPLPSGRYLVRTRGADAAGNVEGARTNNRARLRVR